MNGMNTGAGLGSLWSPAQCVQRIRKGAVRVGG